MKRLTLLIIAFISSAMLFDVAAQSLTVKRIDSCADEAATLLAVDIEVRSEEYVAGPYARYAQKYFGERASLVDKLTYEITSANVAIVDQTSYMATPLEQPAAPAEAIGFPALLPDRTTVADKSLDEAAKSAAEQIFALRRTRLDLITGEFGDGVFGAGLESALAEINRLEQEYLELFYGKSRVNVERKRFIIDVDARNTSVIVARFSTENGLVAKDDLMGDIIMMSICPSDMEYPAANPKGRTTYCFANLAEVIVSVGQQHLVSRVLPIYEFGAVVVL